MERTKNCRSSAPDPTWQKKSFDKHVQCCQRKNLLEILSFFCIVQTHEGSKKAPSKMCLIWWLRLWPRMLYQIPSYYGILCCNAGCPRKAGSGSGVNNQCVVLPSIWASNTESNLSHFNRKVLYPTVAWRALMWGQTREEVGVATRPQKKLPVFVNNHIATSGWVH